jgi:hypothetical protein
VDLREALEVLLLARALQFHLEQRPQRGLLLAVRIGDLELALDQEDPLQGRRCPDRC